MNELKPTYSQRSKDQLEIWAQNCLSKSYGDRFVVEVDAMTGDFILTCLNTGESVESAENDLNLVAMGKVTDVIVPAIVRNLLMQHIDKYAFKWGK